MTHHHAFCNEAQTQLVLTTMAEVASVGTPIDEVSDDDLNYVGPVLWQNSDYAVAINPDDQTLAILGPGGSVSLVPVQARAAEAQPHEAPSLIITLEGGLVTSVCSDRPQLLHFKDILVVDYDTEDLDPDELTAVRQGNGAVVDAAVQRVALEQAAIRILNQPAGQEDT